MKATLKKQFIDDLVLTHEVGGKRWIEIHEAMASALMSLDYNRDPVNQGLFTKDEVEVRTGVPSQEGTYRINGVLTFPEELSHIFEPYVENTRLEELPSVGARDSPYFVR